VSGVSSNPYEGVMFPVKGEVVEACGSGCRAPHAVGEAWYMKGVPAGICSFAFNAMFPAYWTLRFAGVDPSEADPDAMHVTCSTRGCGAVFRLSRISVEEAERLASADRLIPADEVLVIDHGNERPV